MDSESASDCLCDLRVRLSQEMEAVGCQSLVHAFWGEIDAGIAAEDTDILRNDTGVGSEGIVEVVAIRMMRQLRLLKESEAD
ncbi:MAG: hypothetical protein M2R45_01215 [Verrucomicrobia subdivision 3 bacterium]|nr:hypothetical protein [Limisphaerales bacterium]MCS1415233.1 hypothetical protein [Limisphaerales bacterium]